MVVQWLRCTPNAGGSIPSQGTKILLAQPKKKKTYKKKNVITCVKTPFLNQATFTSSGCWDVDLSF